MMNNFVSFLKQPYPYYYKGKNILIFSLVIFTMSMVFNYIFEPFNVYRPEHKFSFFQICLIQSANAAVWSILVFGVAAIFTDEVKWSVKKELILVSILLVVIGVAQFLIRDIIYENPDNWSLKYLIEEVRNAFLIGILFFTIIMSLNFKRLLKLHSESAASLVIPRFQAPLVKETPPLKIITQLKSDNFLLNPNNFIFAKADGNYLEIVAEGENNPKKLVKRLTIKELERQLSSCSFIIKTHRSYLVNINHIDAVKGNAQGYLLSLKNHDEKIPVSRSMIPLFKEHMSMINITSEP